MEVAFRNGFKAIAFIFCLSLSLGCAKKTQNVPSESVSQLSAECAARAITDRYLVYWQNGEVTSHSAASIEELIEKNPDMTPFTVRLIAHDFKISASDAQVSPAATGLTGQDAPNWGFYRINVPALWQKGIFGQDVIVAVVDSGMDVNHPQLRSQIALNPGEIVDGLDNDGNGFIDDVGGYDFIADKPLTKDYSRHGTHVSGIVAADPTIVANSSLGAIYGVAPKARVLPLAFINSKGVGYLGDGIKASRYAVSRGAKVINASWGGSTCTEGLKVFMEDLAQKGVVFINASGNDSLDLDLTPQFPSNLGTSNIITVGATGYLKDTTTQNDFLADFSNHSKNFVHVLAPGINIWSAVPNGYAPLSGTSMAAPFVSGLTALLLSAFPQATPDQIREALVAGSEGRVYDAQGGRVEAEKAYEALSLLVKATGP